MNLCGSNASPASPWTAESVFHPCPSVSNFNRMVPALLRLVNLPSAFPPRRLLQRASSRLHILLLPPLLHPPHPFGVNHAGPLLAPQRAALFDVGFHRTPQMIRCIT